MMARDEYSIDAGVFHDALIEQRTMGLKGSLYHQTQIMMAYNSNRIEGSRLSADQTRYIYETRMVSGDASVDDVVEAANHFRLFDAMLDAVGTPLTVARIRDYHRILKSGTSDSDKAWFIVGGWKSRANVVGGHDTTPPALVAAAMDELLACYPGPMTFEDITDFHYRFESIHPFQDGNGRVGRMVMFEQCLANNIMPFIVLDDEKLFYYRGLSEYEDQPGFLCDTFRHFQDLYYDGYAKFLIYGGQEIGTWRQ